MKKTVTALVLAFFVLVPLLVQADESVNEFDSLCQKREQGDVEAQYWLGDLYGETYPKYTYDHIKAIKWFEKAAAKGHLKAQEALAWLYCEQGKFQKGLKILEKITELGCFSDQPELQCLLCFYF